jgi:hypothetical protein
MATKRQLQAKALEFFAAMMLEQGAKLTPGNKDAEKALIKAKKKHARAQKQKSKSEQ